MTTPVFRVSIRKEEWEATQTTLYRQLGVPKSRELIAAKYTNTPTRGLGEGEFVLIQYRRPVEWATPVLETLTMKRVGEQWKPTGYNIRPFE